MKKHFCVIALMMLSLGVFGQLRMSQNFRPVKRNLSLGLVNIFELNYGYALGDNSFNNTKQYFGLTGMFGYQLHVNDTQIRKSLIAGLVTGVLLYDGTPRIPLYIDLRYIWGFKRISPFIYGDSGLIFSTEEFLQETKMFINPGTGIKIKISQKLSTNISAGILIQMADDVNKESILNFKLGLVY